MADVLRPEGDFFLQYPSAQYSINLLPLHYASHWWAASGPLVRIVLAQLRINLR
jgi:hypothetical protein